MITLATHQPRSPTVPGQNVGIFQTITTPSHGRFLVSNIGDLSWLEAGGGESGREGVVGEGRIKQAFLLDKRLRSPPYDL